jgi:hypothetical protein
MRFYAAAENSRMILIREGWGYYREARVRWVTLGYACLVKEQYIIYSNPRHVYDKKEGNITE